MAEFKQLVDEMGAFPAKDKIDRLTFLAGRMTADHHEIVGCVNFLLVERLASAPVQCYIPTLYILDSILKNVGGLFIVESEKHIFKAFSTCFSAVDAKDKTRMYRLLKSWTAFKPPIFLEQSNSLTQFLSPWIQEQSQSQGQAQQVNYQSQSNQYQNQYHSHGQNYQGQQQSQNFQVKQYQEPFNQQGYNQQASRGSYNQGTGVGYRDQYHGDRHTQDAYSEGGQLKRAKISDDKPEVISRMRHLLAELQEGLTTSPMTLEELWESDANQAQELRSHALATLNRPSVEADEVRGLLEELKQMSGQGGAKECFDALRTGLREERQVHFENLSRVMPAMDGTRADAQIARALFALPLVCKLDNIQFRTAKELSVHEEIMSVRERLLQQPHSRTWNIRTSDWVTESAMEVSQAKDSKAVVSSDGRSEAPQVEEEVACVFGECCRLCGEKFDTVFNEKKEEWVCRGVVELAVEDGEPEEKAKVHKGCADTLDGDTALSKSVLLPSFNDE